MSEALHRSHAPSQIFTQQLAQARPLCLSFPIYTRVSSSLFQFKSTELFLSDLCFVSQGPKAWKFGGGDGVFFCLLVKTCKFRPSSQGHGLLEVKAVPVVFTALCPGSSTCGSARRLLLNE